MKIAVRHALRAGDQSEQQRAEPHLDATKSPIRNLLQERLPAEVLTPSQSHGKDGSLA